MENFLIFLAVGLSINIFMTIVWALYDANAEKKERGKK